MSGRHRRRPAGHYDADSYDYLLKHIHRSVERALEIMRDGEMRDLGELLHETWRKKRELPGTSNDTIDQAYDAAVDAGALTYEKLVQMYLDRIEAYDKNGPELNAVLEIHPRALDIARELDEERRTSGRRSPLHGIPIAVSNCRASSSVLAVVTMQTFMPLIFCTLL